MSPLANMIEMLIQVYSLIILARVLMSWINVDPNSQLGRVIFDLTEPVLAPVRNLMPPAAGLDFSPIIVMVLLQIVGQMVVSALP